MLDRIPLHIAGNMLSLDPQPKPYIILVLYRLMIPLTAFYLIFLVRFFSDLNGLATFGLLLGLHGLILGTCQRWERCPRLLARPMKEELP